MSLAKLTSEVPDPTAEARHARTARRRSSILLSLLLIVVGWTLLGVTRHSYTVEGTIRATVDNTYPWNGGGRFDLLLQLENGRWLRFPSLHGECGNQARLKVACDKPEFPVGAPIRLTVRNFTDPLGCPDFGRFLTDHSCLGRYTRRYSYIEAIEVNGRPVLTGWSSNLSIWAVYLTIFMVGALLALHDWRVSTIRTRTLILYFLMIFGCIFWPLAGFF